MSRRDRGDADTPESGGHRPLLLALSEAAGRAVGSGQKAGA